MSSFHPRMFGLSVRLTGLALVLAVAGPVSANPFGVERRGGDGIAAITSLTPEQARELVAKRTDATARIDTGKAALAFARGGVTLRGALMLSGLESLDAETAAVLASYDEGPLFLDGLSTLSPESALALKEFKGGPKSFASFGRCLSLAGLETLSPEAADELAAFPGEEKTGQPPNLENLGNSAVQITQIWWQALFFVRADAVGHRRTTRPLGP